MSESELLEITEAKLGASWSTAPLTGAVNTAVAVTADADYKVAARDYNLAGLCLSFRLTAKGR